MLDENGVGFGSSLPYTMGIFSANDIYLSWSPMRGLTLSINSCVVTRPVDLYAQSAATWTQLVVTYDSAVNSAQLYVNGLPVAVTTDETCISPLGGPLVLGNLDASGQLPLAFAGRLDDVAVWSAVLSSGEVLSLFASNVRPDQIGTLPVAWYTFDGISAGPISDAGVLSIHSGNSIILPRGYGAAGTIKLLAVSEGAPFLHDGYIPSLTSNERWLENRLNELFLDLEGELAAATSNSSGSANTSTTLSQCESIRSTTIPFVAHILPLTIPLPVASCATVSIRTPLDVTFDSDLAKMIVTSIMIPPPVCSNAQAFLSADSLGLVVLPSISKGDILLRADFLRLIEVYLFRLQVFIPSQLWNASSVRFGRIQACGNSDVGCVNATFSSTLGFPVATAIDSGSGWIYVADVLDQRVLRLGTRSGSIDASFSFSIPHPVALALDLTRQMLYVLDRGTNALYRINLTTLVMDDCFRIQLSLPTTLALAPDASMLYIGDDQIGIVRVNLTSSELDPLFEVELQVPRGMAIAYYRADSSSTDTLLLYCSSQSTLLRIVLLDSSHFGLDSDFSVNTAVQTLATLPVTPLTQTSEYAQINLLAVEPGADEVRVIVVQAPDEVQNTSTTFMWEGECPAADTQALDNSSYAVPSWNLADNPPLTPDPSYMYPGDCCDLYFESVLEVQLPTYEYPANDTAVMIEVSSSSGTGIPAFSSSSSSSSSSTGGSTAPSYPGNCCQWVLSPNSEAVSSLPAAQPNSPGDQRLLAGQTIASLLGVSGVCNGDVARVWSTTSGTWQSTYVGDDQQSHAYQHVFYINSGNQLWVSTLQSWQTGMRNRLMSGTLVQIDLNCQGDTSPSNQRCVEFWVGSQETSQDRSCSGSSRAHSSSSSSSTGVSGSASTGTQSGGSTGGSSSVSSSAGNTNTGLTGPSSSLSEWSSLLMCTNVTVPFLSHQYGALGPNVSCTSNSFSFWSVYEQQWIYTGIDQYGVPRALDSTVQLRGTVDHLQVCVQYPHDRASFEWQLHGRLGRLQVQCTDPAAEPSVNIASCLLIDLYTPRLAIRTNDVQQDRSNGLIAPSCFTAESGLLQADNFRLLLSSKGSPSLPRDVAEELALDLPSNVTVCPGGLLPWWSTSDSDVTLLVDLILTLESGGYDSVLSNVTEFESTLIADLALALDQSQTRFMVKVINSTVATAGSVSRKSSLRQVASSAQSSLISSRSRVVSLDTPPSAPSTLRVSLGILPNMIAPGLGVFHQVSSATLLSILNSKTSSAVFAPPIQEFALADTAPQVILNCSESASWICSGSQSDPAPIDTSAPQLTNLTSSTGIEEVHLSSSSSTGSNFSSATYFTSTAGTSIDVGNLSSARTAVDWRTIAISLGCAIALMLASAAVWYVVHRRNRKGRVTSQASWTSAASFVDPTSPALSPRSAAPTVAITPAHLRGLRGHRLVPLTQPRAVLPEQEQEQNGPAQLLDQAQF